MLTYNYQPIGSSGIFFTLTVQKSGWPIVHNDRFIIKDATPHPIQNIQIEYATNQLSDSSFIPQINHLTYDFNSEGNTDTSGNLFYNVDDNNNIDSDPSGTLLPRLDFNYDQIQTLITNNSGEGGDLVSIQYPSLIISILLAYKQ